MRAWSSPGQGPSIRVGWLVRSSRPSALASRRAGSMVTTQARRPSRAAWRAKAAAVVVLPTPPDPQQMTIDRSRATRSMVVSGPAVVVSGRHGEDRRRRRGGPRPPRPGRALSTSSSAGPMEAVNRKGTRSWARGSSWASRSQLLALELLTGPPEPPGLLERLDQLGLQCDPGVAGRLVRRGLHGVEGGIAAVHDDRAEGDAHLVLELVGGLDHLVDRHLLGQRDQGDLAAGRIGEQGHHVGGLGPDGPASGGVEQAAGRGQEGHGVTGGRGVHQDQVGDAAAARSA